MVTASSILDRGGSVTTESIVMRASSGTVRRVATEHRHGVD